MLVHRAFLSFVRGTGLHLLVGRKDCYDRSWSSHWNWKKGFLYRYGSGRECIFQLYIAGVETALTAERGQTTIATIGGVWGLS